MDITQFPQLNPPSRLLMGPGPINADPRVLRAMSSQLIVPVRPGDDPLYERSDGAVPRRISYRKPLDDAGGRNLKGRD